jgi:hypothetical protein
MGEVRSFCLFWLFRYRCLMFVQQSVNSNNELHLYPQPDVFNEFLERVLS